MAASSHAMDRLTSAGALATSRPDNDRSATNPRDLDTGTPTAPSLFTLKAGGFAFTFPTGYISSVRAIREQAIASYRAVADKKPTARDLAFLHGFPPIESPACGDLSRPPATVVDKWLAGNNNNPTQPIQRQPVELVVMSDGENEKLLRRSVRRNETRQSPTPVLLVGRNRRRKMEDPEPAIDAVKQTPCFLPEESGSGCSRRSEEPETSTDSPNSDCNSPILPERGSGSFEGDYTSFGEAKRATGHSLNWVQGMYCEGRLSICSQFPEMEPRWPLCTGCRNRSKRQWRGPCMFMVGGGDENFSSLRCATCVKRGIHCRDGIDIIKD